MDAGAIVFLSMVYFLIGSIIGASIDMHDNAIMCASFILWPIIILVYACKGLIKILKGDNK